MVKNTDTLGRFARLVRSYREDTGHPTARAFFQAQGGPAFFGCTYKAYLNVENGASVPQPALVERLATALRVALQEAKARAFALAYLSVLLDSEEFLSFASYALAEDGTTNAPGKGAAAQQGLDAPFQLNEAQSKLLASRPETYWAFTLLSNDRDPKSPADLARILGFEAAKLRSALTALRKAGLLASDQTGRFYHPHAGRTVLHPQDRTQAPKRLETIRGYWNSMSQERGGTLLEHPLLSRSSEAELRGYFGYLAQSVLGAGGYARTDAGPDTALFLVEAVVRKLLPF